MKNSKSLSSSFAKAITFATFLLTATLFVSSCQKDEEFNPGKPLTATVNEKQMTQLELSPLKTIFTFIKINHLAAPRTPEYSVTVFSNGSAYYEGISKVGIKGIHKFDVSREKLAAIIELYVQFTSRGTQVFDVKRTMRLQTIETIIQAKNKGPMQIFRDHNDGSAPKLEAFRANIEEQLNIKRFTKNSNKNAEANYQK